MKTLLCLLCCLYLFSFCYAPEVCRAGPPDLVTTSCTISTHPDVSYLAILVAALFIIWMFLVSCLVI
ncbi:membrane protein UL147A [Cercopithecine betaherpesvirus 5]|uniref:Membrane protein UL147A n=1 Tax=Simian cytomegalovirus (strain Colburn) TaxID=50292 RepID=G8XTI4_SCMVC|nr:membrane protein UL147A [Cercopithecine betaherpesvirus 5]AEV80476.1 membrane protein UL147A [Cercopithecine betaherpesvirus 5]